MHVLYHHRTTAQDAQGIHIREILHAFERLGHTTQLVSFANRRDGGAAAERRGAASAERGAERYRLLARLKSVAWLYECAEIAYNFWGFWSLAGAIRRRRPDLIYERYSLFNVCGIVASRLWRIPLVLEVNAPLAYEKQKYEKLALRHFAYASERWICSRSTHTIVVSTPMREILVTEGVPRAHMTVIPNGVNGDEIARRLGTMNVRAHYGLANKFVLGFVGWFKPWHRLDAVLRLMASRPEWRAHMHLLLVGDGPEAAALTTLARELDLAGSLTITGAIGRDLIYDHIAAFDVALQPHVTEYASPMKIFEYLALGKCVVAPDLENTREILRHGTDALLFKAGDPADMARAIDWLACHPARVQEMGQHARHTVRERRYDWTENARRALALVGLGGTGSVAAPLPQTETVVVG